MKIILNSIGVIVDDIEINPLINKKIFGGKFIIKSKNNKISVNILLGSGNSSFVDYLIFDKFPTIETIPIAAVESTKKIYRK